MLLRLPISVLLASVVTFGLFTLMQTLVEMSEVALEEYDKRKAIDFVRLKRDSRTEVKKRELPTRQRPEAPPKAPELQSGNTGGPGATSVAVSAPKIETNLNLRGALQLGGAPADTEAVPVVRVEPIYPQHARSRNIEGWVVVQFDVNTTGAVKNVKILDAHPTGIFERAAERTISKWKYRPKIVDGKAVWQRGQKTKIVFRLDR